MKVAPCPGRLCTWISPPWLRTMPWLTGKPKPVPLTAGLVV